MNSSMRVNQLLLRLGRDQQPFSRTQGYVQGKICVLAMCPPNICQRRQSCYSMDIHFEWVDGTSTEMEEIPIPMHGRRAHCGGGFLL